MSAEVLGGDVGGSVSFIDDYEVVWQEDSFCVGGEAADAEKGEEQGVIYDDYVALLDGGFSSLVVTALVVAVLSVAGSAFGADEFPYFVVRNWIQLLSQSGVGFGGPLGNTLKLFHFVGGEELRFILYSLSETVRAEVIVFSDEDGGFELRVLLKFGDSLEKMAADG